MKFTKRVPALLFAVVAPCVFIFAGCGNNQPMPVVVTEHTITYAGVDGAINPNTVTKYNKNDAEIELQAPTKDNYTFVNWTYNGTEVTKINPLWDQSITLVANWTQNNCYLKLDYDLSEDYRFYFLNEPFSTNFYLFGKYLRVAPEVHLIMLDLDKDLEIPYASGYITMTGFDSKTVGTKHVTLTVDFPFNSQHYIATVSYDVEVKDYDHDKYGYDVVPENQVLEWPNGYILEAKAKNESSVAAYNWFSSNEAPNHAEQCSLPNYNPYLKYTGKTAFESTYVAPAGYYNPNGDSMKLCTIYQDLTRVYTNEIKITYESLPEIQDDYAMVDEYRFGKGETLDLAEKGIGSGTVTYTYNADGSREFVFTNVNYIAQNFQSDLSRAGYGFQYYFNEDMHGVTVENKSVTLKFIGDNYISQPMFRDNGYGIAMTTQHLSGGAEDDIHWTVTLTGGGTLNINGGGTAFYTDCKLVIDDITLNVTSHLGFRTNAINAHTIEVTDNAKVHLYNNGTAMLAMSGKLTVETGAVVDCKITMPHKDLDLDAEAVIQAAGPIEIKSQKFDIEVFLSDSIYGDAEGIKSCVLLQSHFADVTFNGAICSFKTSASNYRGSEPGFGSVVAIATPDSQDRKPGTGSIIIKNSTIKIDLQNNVFNDSFGIMALTKLEVENSDINMNLKSVSGIIGMQCTNGGVSITSNSNVDIKATRANTAANAYGVQTNDVTVTESRLSVDLNSGVGIFAALAIEPQPAKYEKDYTPTKLIGFETLDATTRDISKASVMNGDQPGTYIVYETIYDISGTNPVIAKQFVVDNRTA